MAGALPPDQRSETPPPSRRGLGAQACQRQQPEPEEGVVEAADIVAAGDPLQSRSIANCPSL
jgi:hypothetical protein